MPKRFSLQEAASLLPEVSSLMGEAVSCKAEYEKAEASFQGLLQKIMLAGGILADREQAMERKSGRDRAAQRLKAALEGIHQTGCLVKDLDIGLVDFPTLFRGQEVYLCWKLGEPEIQFWHGVQEGFAGRKPIDQDFLEHHQGDPTQ